MPTKMDVAVMGIFALVCALTAFYWVNSIGYHSEIDNQRQHAIEFLQQHQFDMTITDRDAVMEEYNISMEDISLNFATP